MAAATRHAVSSPKPTAPRAPLPRRARLAVTRSTALKSVGQASDKPPAPPRAWRAPSADTLLALTLLLGLLLNLSAFVDPGLLFGGRGSETWQGPGASEAVLALVPLLSSLALLGIGAYCRTSGRRPKDGE